MIISKYIKSYKTIITLGVFVAFVPLLGIPSWARDTLTYIAGLLIAFGTYMLNKKPREITTIKESLSEPVVAIQNDINNVFTSPTE